MTRFRRSPALLAAALALPLAGCISFGAKPPASLLTLSPAVSPAVGQDLTTGGARSMTIDIPASPQSLATARVPVRISPTSIAYVEKTQWVEPPASLFARLLADTVEARTGRPVLSSVQAVGDPGGHLGGALRSFGIDAQTREAVVVFDAALTRGGGKGVIEERRFEARVPVQSIDAAGIGAPLNDAANRVAAQVADWIGR